MLVDRQPVKLLKERHNIIVYRCAEDQLRTGIHNTWEFLLVMVRDVCMYVNHIWIIIK